MLESHGVKSQSPNLLKVKGTWLKGCSYLDDGFSTKSLSITCAEAGRGEKGRDCMYGSSVSGENLAHLRSEMRK